MSRSDSPDSCAASTAWASSSRALLTFLAARCTLRRSDWATAQAFQTNNCGFDLFGRPDKSATAMAEIRIVRKLRQDRSGDLLTYFVMPVIFPAAGSRVGTAAGKGTPQW